MEVRVKEEIFADFEDVDGFRNVRKKSYRERLGEAFVKAEVEHTVEEEALVAETVWTGT